MPKKGPVGPGRAFLVLGTRVRADPRKSHANVPVCTAITRLLNCLPQTRGAGGEHNRAMALNGQHAVLVWDETGKVSEALRRAALSVPLWRGWRRPKKTHPHQVGLSIVAPYTRTDLSKISSPVRPPPPASAVTTSDRAS